MPRDDDEPPEIPIRSGKEFADILIHMLVQEEAKIERQAAETGKAVDAEFTLATDVITRRVIFRIKVHCEPGKPATHSLDYVDDLSDLLE